MDWLVDATTLALGLAAAGWAAARRASRRAAQLTDMYWQLQATTMAS